MWFSVTTWGFVAVVSLVGFMVVLGTWDDNDADANDADDADNADNADDNASAAAVPAMEPLHLVSTILNNPAKPAKPSAIVTDVVIDIAALERLQHVASSAPAPVTPDNTGLSHRMRNTGTTMKPALLSDFHWDRDWEHVTWQ